MYIIFIRNFKIKIFTSDGSYSPTDVIKAAKKNKLKAISLTVHDSIAGLKEAKIAAEDSNIELINGIEISALYKDGRLLHILGLGIDIHNEYFLNSYNKMKKAREKSVPKILKHIENNHGLSIDINYLHKVKYDEYLSRYDIYRYILENNICTEPQKVWDIYLDPIPYGNDELITVDEAIKMIHEAGGKSYLAHFNKRIGLEGFSFEEIEDNIKYLVSLELDGVERYYPSYTDDDRRLLDYLVWKYQLYSSGGTDYHGANRGNIKIGFGEGNLKIPYSLIDSLKR